MSCEMELVDNGVELEAAQSSMADPDAEPTYDDAFPALCNGGGPAPPQANPPSSGPPTTWATNLKMAVKRSVVTQVFCVPLAERRFREGEGGFGEYAAEQNKLCQDIMSRTGASIELSSAKDGSLTVVLTGKQDAVSQARKFIIQRLQVQARHTISIPKEHHRFVLGAKGKRLQDLENLTITKINIPRPDENSDQITICGTKEGIDRAAEAIQDVSDEQSKLDDKTLDIPKIYHPFICGPNNEHIVELRSRTGARINMPPPHIDRTGITIRGEKEGVQQAYDDIMNIYKDKERVCTTLAVDIKTGLKYVRGPRSANLSEILAETGVSVELPGGEVNSGSITLRGEATNLARALTMVLEKAHAMCEVSVRAPDWLHRFIIGRKGEKINKITAEFPNVHIELADGANEIQLEGPREDVTGAQECLEAIVAELEETMAFAVVNVDQKYHKHVIGKAGSNVSRIKEETGVQIRIKSDGDDNPNEIRIEGPPAGVEQAKKEIEELAVKMANEKSREIELEQRFHKTIIGAQGAKIREIRDRFNQVQISFPDSNSKSDIVMLRGPKNDVDKCYLYLQRVHAELVENNYQAQIRIYKDFHKNIIGKGGATIRKIRDETDTKIDLPSQNIESDVISVTGKKENVELARARIEAIQKELADIVEVSLDIPFKFHNSIIGTKGRLIRSIMDECGGVTIRFPQESTKSDKVMIRGPKDDVEKARIQLVEIASERQECGHTIELRCKPDFHRFLIGKGGSNVRALRATTGARVAFPAGNDSDGDLIVIMGRKEEAEAAQKELEERIQSLENTTEIEMSVEPKHHRHFVIRRGEVLRQIADEFGGVAVSFPRAGVQSDRVVLKGATDLVEGARARIQEIVEDLDAQVTMECVIEQKYHRTVMGPKGSRVQQIQNDFEIQIKFPERPQAQQNGSPNPRAMAQQSPKPALPNGHAAPQEEIDDWSGEAPAGVVAGEKRGDDWSGEAPAGDAAGEKRGDDWDWNAQDQKPLTNGDVATEDHAIPNGDCQPEEGDVTTDDVMAPPPRCDVIILSGRRERCEGARAALEALVPVTEEVEVAADLHRFIIGQRGAEVRRLMEEHDVNISIPQADTASDVIRVTGAVLNVTSARTALLARVAELEAEKADRALRAFRLEAEVDPIHHPKIIGRKGAVISKIRIDHNVNIQFPAMGAESERVITITGYEADCDKARQDILKIVHDLESQYKQEIEVDYRIHPRIIGARGRNVRKIMEKFRVDIKFNSDPENRDVVVVTGAQDDVDDCCEDLMNLAEEYLQDILDEEKVSPSTQAMHESDHTKKAPDPGFVVRNAPWSKSAPDSSSTLDFPELGAATKHAAPVAWGPRRK